MDYIVFFEAHPLFLYLVVGLFSLCVGSFLNVVIYRLPVMLERGWKAECEEYFAQQDGAESEQEASVPAEEKEVEAFNLMVPRSRCPACGHSITAAENIPIISYLWLKGRCSGCGSGISPRYPLVELLTAMVSMLVVWRFGLGWQVAVLLPLTWALVALSLIDYDTQLLPDVIVLPFLWLGLITSLFGWSSISPEQSIVGAAAGYLTLWTVYQVFKLITGKEGMGYGDFKLLALFGAWGGWMMLPQIILLSSLVGALLGGMLILFAGRESAKPIPFGPFLAVAGWISLMWGDVINQTYLQLSGLG